MSRPLERSAWLLRLACGVLLVAAVHEGRELLVPFALALLLTLLLQPIETGLERTPLGRVPAVLITVLIAFSVIGAFGWLTTRQVSDLVGKLPGYRANVIEKTKSLGSVGALVLRGYTSLEGAVADLSRGSSKDGKEDAGREPPPAAAGPRGSSPLDVLGQVFLSMFDALGSGFIVLLLVIFLLIYRDDLRDRVVQLFGAARVKMTTQAMEDAAAGVSRYLLSQALVNGCYGGAITLGLFLIGIPSAALWGVLAALFRFIPYFGPALGAALPAFLSIAVFHGWAHSIALVVFWGALELAVANILEPLLYGKRAGISPLAVLVAAVFWTWAWGGLGLLLSIPLTVSLVVLGRYVPELDFLQTLFGEGTKLEPRIQLYQRLLARDQEAAEEMLDLFQKGKSLAEICDLLLVPVLSLARSDRQRGRLDDLSLEFILKSLGGFLEDLADRAQPPKSEEGNVLPPIIPSTSARDHLVLAIPTADAQDELAARMIERVLGLRGVRSEALQAEMTVGERVRIAADRRPEAVILAAVHPSAFIPVRYLYKKARALLPQTDLAVALLSAPGESAAWSRRILPVDGPVVVTSLRDTERTMEQWLPEILLKKASESSSEATSSSPRGRDTASPGGGP